MRLSSSLLIFCEVIALLFALLLYRSKNTMLVCRMSEDIELGMAEIQRIMQVKSASCPNVDWS